MSVKAGLPPIARPDARLFILGSLPGDASLAAGAYYAHATNQFWRLLGSAVGEELQGLPYDERLATLARGGSLDQAIRLAEHNRIERLLRDFPRLAAIAFNGSTAAVAGRKLIGSPPPNVQLIDLPSSSAANTKAFADKAREWSRLAQFCLPAQIEPR